MVGVAERHGVASFDDGPRGQRLIVGRQRSWADQKDEAVATLDRLTNLFVISACGANLGLVEEDLMAFLQQRLVYIASEVILLRCIGQEQVHLTFSVPATR